MQWEGREESGNVEDQRGLSGRTVAVGGGVGIVVLILAALFGFDPQNVLQFLGQFQGQNQQQVEQGQRPFDPEEEKLAQFTKVILRDTEIVWGDLFKKMGKTYPEPKLVLFTDRVQSAC